MPAHSPFTVVWDKNQRAALEQLANSRTAPLRRIQRAEVALAAADGASNAAIARSHRLHIATVRRWRKRFHHEGMAALDDRRRPGRPRRYGPEVHLAIVATVTSAKPAPDSQWTHKSIAKTLAAHGISASQIGRILADLDLKPHLVRGWLTRPNDPDFHVKAAEVCALYLHRPHGSVVLSVDEKTAMQARSRRHPTRPAWPGHAERREFEYRRHGTASIVAALDVHSGQVLVEDCANCPSPKPRTSTASVPPQLSPTAKASSSATPYDSSARHPGLQDLLSQLVHAALDASARHAARHLAVHGHRHRCAGPLRGRGPGAHDTGHGESGARRAPGVDRLQDVPHRFRPRQGR